MIHLIGFKNINILRLSNINFIVNRFESKIGYKASSTSENKGSKYQHACSNGCPNKRVK